MTHLEILDKRIEAIEEEKEREEETTNGVF
jgi:hypothetical protein